MTTTVASTNALPIGFSIFFVAIWVVLFGMYGVGIATLISLARKPDAVFGPWWDNTKQIWIIGAVVAFLVPFGPVIVSIMWFAHGKAPLRRGEPLAGRPFWAGAAKPPPPYPPYPPYGYPPAPGQPPWQ